MSSAALTTFHMMFDVSWALLHSQRFIWCLMCHELCCTHDVSYDVSSVMSSVALTTFHMMFDVSWALLHSRRFIWCLMCHELCCTHDVSYDVWCELCVCSQAIKEGSSALKKKLKAFYRTPCHSRAAERWIWPRQLRTMLSHPCWWWRRSEEESEWCVCRRCCSLPRNALWWATSSSCGKNRRWSRFEYSNWNLILNLWLPWRCARHGEHSFRHSRGKPERILPNNDVVGKWEGDEKVYEKSQEHSENVEAKLRDKRID